MERKKNKKEIKKRRNYVELEIISHCYNNLSMTDVITFYGGPWLCSY